MIEFVTQGVRDKFVKGVRVSYLDCKRTIRVQSS